ncbi:hypothetical protein LCGC14_0893590 [marine sediment metagenome]|uniref:Uncharacterized protein n=1 Tax=marine sediment metagenome TaxID=412755 RepID=A0A0F9NYI6_9ZZZZ
MSKELKQEVNVIKQVILEINKFMDTLATYFAKKYEKDIALDIRKHRVRIREKLRYNKNGEKEVDIDLVGGVHNKREPKDISIASKPHIDGIPKEMRPMSIHCIDPKCDILNQDKKLGGGNTVEESKDEVRDSPFGVEPVKEARTSEVHVATDSKPPEQEDVRDKDNAIGKAFKKTFKELANSKLPSYLDLGTILVKDGELHVYTPSEFVRQCDNGYFNMYGIICKEDKKPPS